MIRWSIKTERRMSSHGNAFTVGLRELNLEQNFDLFDNAAMISAFSKRCPNLVKLNLSYAVLSSECLSIVAANCRRLQELLLRACEGATNHPGV